MTIHRLALTKADIMLVPSPERECLVAFMVMGTEVNTLLSCVLRSGPQPGQQDIEGRAQAAQEFHLTRLLAGTLHESWSTVHDLFTGCPVAGAKLKAYLRSDALEAYERLKSFYGKRDSTLAHVRNKLGFHFDFDAIVKGFSETPEDATMDVCFVGTSEPQARYLGSTIVLANAVERVMDDRVGKLVQGDTASSAPGAGVETKWLGKFLHDTTDTADRMTHLFYGWTTEVLQKHLPNLVLQDIQVRDTGRMYIPAFYDFANDRVDASHGQTAPGSQTPSD